MSKCSLKTVQTEAYMLFLKPFLKWKQRKKHRMNAPLDAGFSLVEVEGQKMWSRSFLVHLDPCLGEESQCNPSASFPKATLAALRLQLLNIMLKNVTLLTKKTRMRCYRLVWRHMELGESVQLLCQLTSLRLQPLILENDTVICHLYI